MSAPTFWLLGCIFIQQFEENNVPSGSLCKYTWNLLAHLQLQCPGWPVSISDTNLTDPRLHSSLQWIYLQHLWKVQNTHWALQVHRYVPMRIWTTSKSTEYSVNLSRIPIMMINWVWIYDFSLVYLHFIYFRLIWFPQILAASLIRPIWLFLSI